MGFTKKNELLIRVYLVMICFFILSAIIMWRACKVSIFEGDTWKEKGGRFLKWLPVETDRGSIYSHDGCLLATSVQFFEIRIDPAAPSENYFNADIDSLSIFLEKYADFNKSRYEWKSYIKEKRDAWNQRKENGSRNVLLVKKADHDLYRKFKSFPLLRRGANAGGLIVNRFSRRTKPFKDLAFRTIGIDRENHEKVGLEDYYDTYLSGSESKQLMKRISGVWVPADDIAELNRKKGDDIVSTIDISMQDILHGELYKAMEFQEANEACAVIMEVKTGKIRAISNLSKDGNLIREEYNHAIGKSGEPGSTFKLATVLALLESGKAHANSQVDLKGGQKRFYDQTMSDSHIHGRGLQTLSECFVSSSNVGIATFAQQHFGGKTKAKDYIQYLESFGLTAKTGIGIQGEPSPYIKDPEKNSAEWYGTTIPWMSHGYELKLTPLQVLSFYNTVANDGKLMKPMLVTEILREDKVLKEFKPKVINHQIASQANIDEVKLMMENVILDGTAKNIKSAKYTMAGKTGTASVNYNSDKGKHYNASFAGYFPADDPVYSMIVVIYNPKKDYYGNAVAAPVFKSVADRCFAIKPELQKLLENSGSGIVENKVAKRESGYHEDFKEVLDYVEVDFQARTKNPWVALNPKNSLVSIEEKLLKPKVVPDVRGMGVRDAVYVLENLGMDVDLSGVGKVDRQSILPGTSLRDQRIELYLN